MSFFCFTYLLAVESITQKKSKGEVLVFRRAVASKASASRKFDEEAAPGPSDIKPKQGRTQGSGPAVVRQTAIFHWEDVCYDVKIKTETPRILDHVDGWVKPGTLTALMVSIHALFLSRLYTDNCPRVSLELERLLFWMF
jgi:hypothetical protein